MTFGLSIKNNNPPLYANHIVKHLVGLLGADVGAVTDAEFSDSQAKFLIKTKSINCPENAGVSLEKVEKAKAGYWCTLSLDEGCTINFELDTTQNKGIHSLLSTLLNPAQPLETRPKLSFRDIELDVPHEVYVRLNYKTPLQAWHGMPLPYVSSANIKIGSVMLGWPRTTGTAMPNPCGVELYSDGEGHGCVVEKMKRELINRAIARSEKFNLKERLLLLEDRLTETGQLTLKSLAEIETCLLEAENAYMPDLRDRYVEFLVEGKIPVIALTRIPHLYDHSLETAKITLHSCVFYADRAKLEIRVPQHLENAARIAALLPEGRGKLGIEFCVPKKKQEY
ncbi:hypothetical protein HY486_00585 [Candidatus Woesearchaeota archaeon]|nr:hypothetical protein [Candidatus Woesearchaeota archaeon]